MDIFAHILFLLILQMDLAAGQVTSAGTVTAAPADGDKVDTSEKESPRPLDISRYNKLLDTPYALFPHKGTYLLPVSYNWRPDQSLYAPLVQNVPNRNSHEYYQKTEAEIQISFMIPAYRRLMGTQWDVLFAYTHRAWWQLYNAAWSKPFRETNYTPELFARRLDTHPWQIFGFDLVAYDIGLVHESNGQIQLLSRSWDRAFARTYFRGSHNMFLILSGWVRLPEESDRDDNTRILKYMGMGDAELYHRFGSHSWSVKVPFARYPGVEFKYSYPWANGLRWFVDYRFGYGHSLIEHDREIQRLGLGITLENFMDKEE